MMASRWLFDMRIDFERDLNEFGGFGRPAGTR